MVMKKERLFMKKINLHEAKTHLSKLIKLAHEGHEIIICKDGTPVARLIPYTLKKEPRTPGIWSGKVVIKKNFDLLPADFMKHFT
jgi:prevent-host-death family protein